MLDLIDSIKFWVEFFLDKRFAFDFKLANFIMGDSLRNYLAVDLLLLKDGRRLDKVAADIKTLMEG